MADGRLALGEAVVSEGVSVACWVREMTGVLDRAYMPLFFTYVMAGLGLGICYGIARNRVVQLRRNLGDAKGVKRMMTWLQGGSDEHPTSNELTAVNFGWLRRVCVLGVVSALLVFVYPFVSPTFCENVICKGHAGSLKPKVVCIAKT